MKKSCNAGLRALVAGLFVFAGIGAQAQSTPSSQFIDNGNGTVTHLLTGLVWKRCAEGQVWSGSTCTGDDNWTYSFSEASALGTTFAGKSDWRLPSVWELSTIVDYTTPSPAINSAIFPNHPSTVYWTDTMNRVSMGWGDVGLSDNFGSARVRMVRGRLATATASASEFLDNGDGTVTHRRTGLMWKRCLQGQPWTGSTCAGSANVYSFNDARSLTTTFAGYSDWRTANIQEVLSIMNFASSPRINQNVMPNMSGGKVWSSTVYVGPNFGYTAAWYSWVSTGYTDDETVDFLYYPVLMVRNTQRGDLLAFGEANCLFNWGEDRYPAFISPKRPVTAYGYGNYTYRYYSATGNYAGISDADGMLYLRASSGAMENLGPAAQWAETAGCR